MLIIVLTMHIIIKMLVKLIHISLYAVLANSSLNPLNQTYANASNCDGTYAIIYLAAVFLTGSLVHK